MQPAAFLTTPANALAFHAVEACLRGDRHFAKILLCGGPGAGKSALVAWGRSHPDAGVQWEDPLVEPLPFVYPEELRLVATLSDLHPEAGPIRRHFLDMGGRVFSVARETELTLAVAQAEALSLGLDIDPEVAQMVAEKLHSPGAVRGAFVRLKAEAALAGVTRVDALFALRTLGEFLYPPR